MISTLKKTFMKGKAVKYALKLYDLTIRIRYNDKDIICITNKDLIRI